MHHLRGNAIPATHVQNPLSDSYEIFFSWGIHMSQNLNIIGLEMWDGLSNSNHKK